MKIIEKYIGTTQFSEWLNMDVFIENTPDRIKFYQTIKLNHILEPLDKEEKIVSKKK